MGRHPAGEIFKCIFFTENDCTLAEFVPECPIHQSHKSHNAPVPYPTMHHSEQKCSHFCSECWIVGYGTGELWDLWLRSIDNKSILVWLMAPMANGLVPLAIMKTPTRAVCFSWVFSRACFIFFFSVSWLCPWHGAVRNKIIQGQGHRWRSVMVQCALITSVIDSCKPQ